MARIFRSIFKSIFFAGKRVLFFVKSPENKEEDRAVNKDIAKIREEIAERFEKSVKIEKEDYAIKEDYPQIKNPSPDRLCIRKLFQLIIPSFTRAILKIRIEGQENIPDESKLMIIANHETFIDVPLIGVALVKHILRIRWVVNRGIYNLWYLKWVYWIHQCIVVDHGTTDKIKNELSKDRWVLIFPEGGKNLCKPVVAEEEKRKPRTGSAVIALSTGVTMLPICIVGADKVLPACSCSLDTKHRIVIRIGKPFKYEKVNDEKLKDKEFVMKIKQDMLYRIYSMNEKD